MNRLIPALAGCVLAALVFADSAHMPFNPPLHSQKITITVD
jgi:hypothetical protein